jgi:hypothetical protein
MCILLSAFEMRFVAVFGGVDDEEKIVAAIRPSDRHIPPCRS